MLQHVLPKGFRRARNYGFLHPNSKRLTALLRLLVFELVCRCGCEMRIVRTRILPCMTASPPLGAREKDP